ncbi:MAG TPA: hypothetical protein VLM79_33970 [Kofleriaceae bacterium]|nr:hypothetical protein [Kofleriaceae bacterium]
MTGTARPARALAKRWLAPMAALAAACLAAPRSAPGAVALEAALAAELRTTSGAIAIENLDHQIAQRGDEPGVEELLLTRAQLLADHDALDRTVALAESRCANGPCPSAGDYLRRARARSAVHRFTDALGDLDAADQAPPRDTATDANIASLRASIWVATGHAGDAIPTLEGTVAHHATLASRSALASAYAAVGRFSDADLLYAAAIDTLETTSPFPYAWLYFSRGVVWDEQARDSARAATMYQEALRYLPQLAAASIHLAAIEAVHGDPAVAAARIAPLARSGNPEALALASSLHLQAGDRQRGQREIADAQARFEALLARHPLAFADHAAAFYLGAGADPARACALAQLNLVARRTHRALDLAIATAHAAGRSPQGCGFTATEATARGTTRSGMLIE